MAAKKKIYTIAEAAKKLGISKAAVYDAISDHRLKATEGTIKVSALLISAADLEKYSVSASHQSRGKKN
jgi:excisionase family DNA binding protein